MRKPLETSNPPTLTEQHCDTVGKETPNALVTQLLSWNAGRRRTIMEALHQQSAAATEPLLDFLNALEIRNRRKQRWGQAVLFSCVALSVLWWMLLPYSWAWSPIFIPLIVIGARLRATTGSQIDAARILAEIDDVRVVGKLTEALRYVDFTYPTELKKTAMDSLTRLLPRLTSQDGSLLSLDQRSILHRFLVPVYPDSYAEDAYDFMLAILMAFEKIGNEADLQCIDRLIKRNPRSFNERHLRTTALICRDVLSSRLSKERSNQHLLRMASEKPISGDDLLHPAEIQHDESRQQIMTRGHASD